PRDRRHDGGVDDAETFDAVDAQLGVDHRAHGAGRGGGVDGLARMPDPVEDVLLRIRGRDAERLARDGRQRRLRRDLEGDPYAGEDARAILLGRQEVAAYGRLRIG